MGTQVSLRLGLLAGLWLCPLWWGATPVIPSLLWCGTGLGLLLLLDLPAERLHGSLQNLFWMLLLSLGLMIAWRSASLQNTLAACLCLLGIGLAARMATQLRKQNLIHLLAWGWLLASLINAAFGLIQYFGFTSELHNTAFGFLRQRNQLATLCNIGLFAALYLWQQQRLSTSLAFASTWLLTAALAATCSRVGLLEFSAVILLLTFHALWGMPPSQTKPRRELLGVIAILLVSYCLFAWTLPLLSGSHENLFNRVVSTSNGSAFNDSRRLLWDNTLTLIHESPWIGKGWRELAYALNMTDFGSAARFSEQADNAHNLPLQFAAELGVPFTALWLAGLGYLVVKNKPWISREPEHLLAWGVLVLIGTHSLLEYPLWYAPFQIATGFAAGIIFTQSHTVMTNRVASRFNFNRWLGALFIGFCAYTAFDYIRVSQLFLETEERLHIFQANTLEKAEKSWLFEAQVRYAKLYLMPITRHNAPEIYSLAREVLHFSPEPRVFQSLIRAGDLLTTKNPQVIQELVVYRRQLKLITLK